MKCETVNNKIITKQYVTGQIVLRLVINFLQPSHLQFGKILNLKAHTLSIPVSAAPSLRLMLINCHMSATGVILSSFFNFAR